MIPALSREPIANDTDSANSFIRQLIQTDGQTVDIYSEKMLIQKYVLRQTDVPR